MIWLSVMFAAVEFVVVQTLDGRHVHINPSQVTNVSESSETRSPEDKLMSDKVHCVILLTNGTKVSIAETCDSVKKRLEQAK